MLKSSLVAVALLALLALVTVNRAAEDFIIRKDNTAKPAAPIAKPAAPVAKPGGPSAQSAVPAAKPAAPSASPSTASAATASKVRKPQAIKLATRQGESAADAWHRYFASLPPVTDEKTEAKRAELDGDIRQTVRELMTAQKFDHVVALIEAALRTGHPQPWMYQALSLALTAAKAPPAQIERALMSAVDFAGGDTTQLAFIAHYMARHGLDRRAIKIFRQVSDLEPTRHEPYLHTLAIAQRLDDMEAMEWAVLGILGQAWPKSQEHIEKDAAHQAKALLERLNKEGRVADAKRLREKINAALERDLVVQVSWTGQADLDIAMQEPTGTTCSFRNPRTTAGGVMLGDSFAGQPGKTADSYTETYICPKAFSGRYQMLIRKVWGEVTANQVKVKVISRKSPGTANESEKQVSLVEDSDGEKQVVINEIVLNEGTNFVQLSLEGGRRTEPISEIQVANAIRSQQALGRQILAQQVGGLDSDALRNLAASRALAGNGDIPGVLPIPIVQGAVGFRPVITTLPEGANLAATAVISADRRYVRITTLPLFSKIGKVLAFNIITGRITDGNPDVGNNAGGGGGGGGGGAPGPGGPAR